MKIFDWILLIWSLSWFSINLGKLWLMMNSFEVRFGKKTIEIGWPFFYPIIMWLIIAYRVGG